VDNLYTSTRFFREASVGKNQALCHGVARKSGRGLSKSVKAAVLTGDPDIPGLVAFNVYDTKPVHFFFYGLHWPQMD